jgi:outer membrane receptor for ferrienterochelin and colicins
MVYHCARRRRRASLRKALLACATLLSLIPPAWAQEAQTADAEQDPAEREEREVIIVQATRSGRVLEDEPIRVEVIGREEIEEKLLMTPGNISMLVAETGGLRVQNTSPAMGASNVRVQGMNGRFTSLLADGLPLYGQSSSVGLLQIAPTDLGQVEVIKGAASALYGPSALGGVINLVSRRPDTEPRAELLGNVTSRDGQDLTAYADAPFAGSWGVSGVAGAHRQSPQDLDDDGWADIPEFERYTVRPRVFWEGAGGARAFATVGAMAENRQGGTLPGRSAPDGRPFVQAQDATRLDAGLVAELPLGETASLHLRGSGVRQDHGHRFGDVVEDDRHNTTFAEASYSNDLGRTQWLAGLAFQQDGYKSETFPQFDYTFDAPALFAQVEHEALETLTLAASARFDDHSEYGGFLSPRISALWKSGDFTVRGSLGSGFYAPTPFVEEIEAAGLSRLAPLGDLEAETAETASLDVGYRTGGWETNVTLFGSDLHDAVRLEEIAGGTGVRLVNTDGTTRTRGGELLLRYRWDAFTLTGSYVHVDATEPNPDGPGRRDVPLTPRNTAGFVAMWEEHGRGRIGFEAYYSGEQALEDDPYRTKSEPYVEMGLLGEIIFGNVSIFLNLENLLDVRQTKEAPLLRPLRAADGRWTVDAWAPLDGFTVNGGVRLRFGGE